MALDFPILLFQAVIFILVWLGLLWAISKLGLLPESRAGQIAALSFGFIAVAAILAILQKYLIEVQGWGWLRIKPPIDPPGHDIFSQLPPFNAF